MFLAGYETKEVAITQGRKARYFYGWNIVIAKFLSEFAYVEQYTSTLGLFFKPLQAEFGWSRTAIAAVQTIARVTEAVIAPVVGPLVDRYGPRVLMPIGAIIAGLTMLGVTQIHALWQFYLLRGVVVAFGFTLMGRIVSDVAINNWFIRKRGRALAISRMGGNVSNVFFIPVTVFVIAASGWRTMFVIFAILAWLVVLIPSAIMMRRRPEDMGMCPDGIEPGIAEAAPDKKKDAPRNMTAPVAEPIWSRREVFSTRSFWLLTICFGIDTMAFQGINISLAPYIQDLGYNDTALTAVMTFRAFIMAAVKASTAFSSSGRAAALTLLCVAPFPVLW